MPAAILFCMHEPTTPILIADRDTAGADDLAEQLKIAGYTPVVVSDAEKALRMALEDAFEAVITEFDLVGTDGLNLIALIHAKRPRLPIVMVTANTTSDTAIEAIKNGAYDYLTKPVDFAELLQILSEAVACARLIATPVEIGQVYEDQDTIIGRSRGMTTLYKELGRVASQPVTVLVRGETGSGKELIVRAIYQHGHRASQPFVAVNCAAIPENLLESELFGHEKGAFTGAYAPRVGRFEQAHNGTIFLDEIGDMDLSLQRKLLRVLQEKQIQRLGGRDEIPVDVRVIAATHRDLESMIEAGTFREDLFYRLNVATITIPPLRERREDIPLLVSHFLHRYGQEFGIEHPSIRSQGMGLLEAQEWPGNVRQLQNVVRRALLGSRGYPIGWSELRDIYESSEIGARPAPDSSSLDHLVSETLALAENGTLPAAYPAMIKKVEQRLFAAAIQRSRGNQAKAARWLGVSRFTMREKLHRYGLHPNKGKS